MCWHYCPTFSFSPTLLIQIQFLRSMLLAQLIIGLILTLSLPNNSLNYSLLNLNVINNKKTPHKKINTCISYRLIS